MSAYNVRTTPVNTQGSLLSSVSSAHRVDVMAFSWLNVDNESIRGSVALDSGGALKAVRTTRCKAEKGTRDLRPPALETAHQSALKALGRSGGFDRTRPGLYGTVCVLEVFCASRSPYYLRIARGRRRSKHKTQKRQGLLSMLLPKPKNIMLKTINEIYLLPTSRLSRGLLLNYLS